MANIRQFSPSEIDDLQISIIIPTLREVENLKKLLPHLRENGKDRLKEIIVVDASSKDGTEELCEELGVNYIETEPSNRACQQNIAAKQASGDVLYFVHADTYPPDSYIDDILDSLKLGFGIGCYPFEFDKDNFILKMQAKTTRMDKLWTRGGDQSLFIGRENFENLGGFDEKRCIMEEYDFIRRAKKVLSFRIMKHKHILVSARKYDGNSLLKVNFANVIAFTMFSLNIRSEKIRSTYKWLLNQSRT